MPGLSERALRVRVVNANWTADSAGGDGTFQLLVITEDDQRHTVPVTPSAAAGIAALAREGTVLLWDPDPQTLVIANVIGEWLPADFTRLRPA